MTFRYEFPEPQPRQELSQAVRDALAPTSVRHSGADQTFVADSTPSAPLEVAPVDIRDEVAVAVEAYRLVAPFDIDEVTESITQDFAKLDTAVTAGESYIQIPRSVASLATMVLALDGDWWDDCVYPKTSVNEELWTPRRDPGGYSEEELGNLEYSNNSDWRPHGRLAVYNTYDNPRNLECPEELLLHFLGNPFDNEDNTGSLETQLEAIADAKHIYEQEHPDLTMTPLNAHAVVMIALMRRIKGEPMPMEWGYMRDATLRRTVFSGRTYVGRTNSYKGGLEIGADDGRASPSFGVGLSVGPKV